MSLSEVMMRQYSGRTYPRDSPSLKPYLNVKESDKDVAVDWNEVAESVTKARKR